MELTRALIFSQYHRGNQCQLSLVLFALLAHSFIFFVLTLMSIGLTVGAGSESVGMMSATFLDS